MCLTKLDQSLYFLKLPDQMCQPVGHLFEHIFLLQFLAYAKKRGYHLSTLDRIAGETFQSIIFIYSDPADLLISRLINDFIGSKPQLNDHLVGPALSEIACEERCDYRIADKDLLLQHLRSLLAINFQSMATLSVVSHRPKAPDKKRLTSGLAIAKCPRKFQLAKVDCLINGCSPSDMAVAANILPIFCELVAWLMKQLGIRYDGWTISDSDDQKLTISLNFVTFVDGYTREMIQDIIKHALTTDITKYKADLARYVDLEYRPTGLTYDYSTIGTLTSWKKLHQQLTSERIRQIWRRINLGSISEIPCSDGPRRASLR